MRFGSIGKTADFVEHQTRTQQYGTNEQNKTNNYSILTQQAMWGCAALVFLQSANLSLR